MLKDIQTKINNYLKLYHSPPTSRKEYRIWIRRLIKEGESVFRILSSSQYKQLSDSIKEFKYKFRPSSIRSNLKSNGYDYN